MRKNISLTGENPAAFHEFIDSWSFMLSHFNSFGAWRLRMKYNISRYLIWISSKSASLRFYFNSFLNKREWNSSVRSSRLLKKKKKKKNKYYIKNIIDKKIVASILFLRLFFFFSFRCCLVQQTNSTSQTLKMLGTHKR